MIWRMLEDTVSRAIHVITNCVNRDVWLASRTSTGGCDVTSLTSRNMPFGPRCHSRPIPYTMTIEWPRPDQQELDLIADIRVNSPVFGKRSTGWMTERKGAEHVQQPQSAKRL
jgi:hypothetical protein